jgi:hypothetical protein
VVGPYRQIRLSNGVEIGKMPDTTGYHYIVADHGVIVGCFTRFLDAYHEYRIRSGDTPTLRMRRRK